MISTTKSDSQEKNFTVDNYYVQEYMIPMTEWGYNWYIWTQWISGYFSLELKYLQD